MVRKQNHISFMIIMIMTICVWMHSSMAAKVGKYTYFGVPEKLQGKEFAVPSDMVAMGEFVTAKKSTNATSVNMGGAAVFLIIDNSSSMYSQGNDQWGIRFSVTKAIIDSIYRINPNCEVGVTVFNAYNSFCQTDDNNIFTHMLTQLQEETDAKLQNLDTRGSFIKLLKLNQTYQSAKAGSKTGYEILKYYMQTDTITPKVGTTKYVGLKYVPSDPVLSDPSHSSGTNISAGFQAAKYAMKKSIYPPDKQFIIFFSDGDANMPAGYKDLWFLFVDGKAVPATFSFYLTPGDTIPQSIVKMTENIKNNNFSASNKFTTLWSIKSNQDAMMDLMKKQLFPLIFSTVISKTPKKLSVNTLENTAWNNNGFLYDKLFPLKGEKNPFAYVLTYAVVKDSITPNGTTQTQLKDTVANISYSANLQEGPSTPDSTRLAYWARTLGFFVDGNDAIWIDDKVKNMELRFEASRIDTLYGYTNVVLELLTTSAGSPDKETLALTANGQLHEATIGVAVGVAAKQGDGVVQHQVRDTIIAIFRNKELPLDTLRDTVVTGIGGFCAMHQGIYFDINADGFVDSVAIAMQGNGSIVTDNLAELAALISGRLPSFRRFALVEPKVLPAGLALLVKENNTTPTTYTTAEDVCSLSDTVFLKNGGMLTPSKISFIDSIAPVVMKAHLQDYLQQDIDDELTVTLSEDVGDIAEPRPFCYLAPNGGAQYSALLSVKKLTGTTGLFLVKGLENATAIRQGDSIWINAPVQAPVSDTKGNSQRNPANVKRPITVTTIKAPVQITRGVYYDRTADGYIDEIFIGISGKKKEDIDKIREKIVLPAHRQFSVVSAASIDVGIILKVQEKTAVAHTATTADDVAVIKDTIVCEKTGELIVPSKVVLEDSIAPVIMSAILVDSLKTGARDELTVYFSEKIDKTSQSIPFHFYTNMAPRYDARLTLLRHQDEASLFSVDSVLTVPVISPGDSIWINASVSDNIHDFLNNHQTNDANIKRQIQVQTIAMPFELILKASLLDRTSTVNISGEIITINPQIEQMLKSVPKEGDAYKGVMIFTLEPDDPECVTRFDRFTGIITLFDAIGNQVLTDRRMVYDAKTKRCLYFWDGLNAAGRKVGMSSYLAVVQVERFVKDERVSVKPFYRLVGVKN
ncbi:MAG: hypothetical protein JW795_13375 [Chitinivibrionales bacterium]|nr:hypothetical protein [Chitinivibrionales bacterium]